MGELRGAGLGVVEEEQDATSTPQGPCEELVGVPAVAFGDDHVQGSSHGSEQVVCRRSARQVSPDDLAEVVLAYPPVCPLQDQRGLPDSSGAYEGDQRCSLGGQGKGSIWQVLVDAFRTGGVKALYRGATPTLLGAIPFDGIRFGVVGVLRRYPHEPESRGRAVGRSAVYGGCGGLVAGVATFPNDTIRRCLQQPHSQYRGYVDCALQLVRADGVPRLYRGLAPSLLRAAPSAAIQFAAFDFFSGVVLGRNG